MCRTIGADNTGPVYRKANRKALKGYIVHDLIVATLEECRIDRSERFHALGGKAGCECDTVLFGDTNVEGAIWKCPFKQI